MIEIYHNPRCSKSRAGLKYLEENNIEYTVVDYLKSGLTVNIVKELADKTNMSAIELVRQHEDYYKKELKGRELSDSQLFDEIAANPKLLHRPIVVNKQKAVFAQPPEKIKEVL